MSAADATATSPQARMLLASDLPGIVDAWGALYDAAVETNPFFGPDYLIPLVRTPGLAPRFSACAVWSGARLIAFAPLIRPALTTGVARAFAHPMVVGGTPLLHGDDPDGAAAALLSALGALRQDFIYIIDDIRLDWPAWRALSAAAARQGGETWTLDAYTRPGVAASGRSGPQERSKKIARNLKRLSTRLAERGAWDIRTPVEPDARAAALRDLLAIEAAGWKGAAKTALASRPETLAFAQAAFHPANQRPRCDYRVLACDGKPIAASVNLMGHDHAAAFKCAYDEAYGAFSPGQLLDAAMADEAHTATTGIFLDSVAAPNHPVERLWRDGVRVGVGAVSLRPGPSRRTALAWQVELTRRRLRATAKRLYHRFKAANAGAATAAAPARADGD